MLTTIGPHWDGNEVWLLTAGGATFASFPHWYATMFSAFYLPLLMCIIGFVLLFISLVLMRTRTEIRARRLRALQEVGARS